MPRFIDHDAILWDYAIHLQGDKPLPADPPPTPNHVLATRLREVADALGTNLVERAAQLAGPTTFDYWDWIGGMRESRSPILPDAESIGRDIYRVLSAVTRKGATPSDAMTLRSAADLLAPSGKAQSVHDPIVETSDLPVCVTRAVEQYRMAEALLEDQGCDRVTYKLAKTAAEKQLREEGRRDEADALQALSLESWRTYCLEGGVKKNGKRGIVGETKAIIPLESTDHDELRQTRTG